MDTYPSEMDRRTLPMTRLLGMHCMLRAPATIMPPARDHYVRLLFTLCINTHVLFLYDSSQWRSHNLAVGCPILVPKQR